MSVRSDLDYIVACCNDRNADFQSEMNIEIKKLAMIL